MPRSDVNRTADVDAYMERLEGLVRQWVELMNRGGQPRRPEIPDPVAV
jgi:hypothetical protein